MEIGIRWNAMKNEIYLDLFGVCISLIISSDFIRKLQMEMRKPAQLLKLRKAKRYTYLVLEMTKKKAPKLSKL